MSSVFPPRLMKYILRTQSDFFRNSVNSNKYVLNSIRFLASKVFFLQQYRTKTKIKQNTYNSAPTEIMCVDGEK